jgi:hypothetical protein
MKRLGLALLFIAGSADAAWKPKQIDAVVASVDGKAITLTEVRKRAEPLIFKIKSTERKERWGTAEAQIMRDMIDRLIRERVMAADVRGLSDFPASESEVKAGVKAIAANAKVTVQQLYEEAAKIGFDPSAYNEEVRRQIDEQRWFNVRVRPTMKPGADEDRARRERLEELETRFGVERGLL